MSHSFLSDPAFSPDPHSNPYFVSNGEPAWASSPLVGHPVLKKKNRRPTSNFAHPISAGDFDFQLIQPPNSPDIPTSATQTASSFPLLNDTGPHSTQAAPEALKQSDATPTLNNSEPSQPPSPPPPPLEQAKEGKKKKKRRMPFLSRRKSSLTPAPTPSTTNVQDKKAQIQAIRSDATQRSQPVPARNISEPMSQNGVLRPAALSRPATSGASTPTARSVTSGSGVPSQNTSARSQDLDRIDELDETNPWGISLHHGGPYEAASQALRNPMFPGQGNSMLNEYPRQVLHAHGNPYFPPQVPEGVSLGLSPGQILPRNFVMPQGRYPRRQATVGSTRETMPPKIMASTPALRRQSQPVPSMSTFPNPHPIIPHDLPPPARIPPPPPPSHPQRQPETLRPGPKPEKSDVLSFDIGMAMLQPEVSEPSNPSIYLQPETINGSEFDPYDLVHLETAHSRTPSPLVHEPSPERSREPTPDPLSERLIPQPTIFRKAPELPESLRPGSNNQVSNNNTPLYREVEAVSLPTKQIPAAQPQDQSQSHSRNHSPLPPPSTAPYGNVDRNDSTLPLGLETPAAEVKSAFASPPQLPNEERERSGAQIPITRNIREQVNLGLPAAPDYDARSTNQSISTYTSSQMRNGRPPPHRRVPKHLVMPAPLNTAANNPPRPQPTRTQQTRPPSQFGPATVQVQIRAQSPYSTGPQILGPFVPNLVSQGKQVASGGKLRKKLSTKLIPPKTNMPSAPIIANVSFAPPVIGYGPPSSLEAASNPSGISKRFLSKRRTDL